jgi:lipopolysaccharide transport system permease protein
MSTTIDKSTNTTQRITTTADQESATPHTPPSEFQLPEEPLVVIQPGNSWSALDLRDLWAHRELLYFFIWRDLKVRYKQTLLGVAWIVIQPLLMTLIFTVFLGKLARVPTGAVPYALTVYTGLVPWMFFSSALNVCSYSLVGNANLITKVYFPRVLVPAASVGAKLVDLMISLAILVCLMLYYRAVLHYPIAPTWNLIALPFLIVLLTLLTFGLGTLAAGLNVKYRDVSMALPVLIQLWMFVSPVVYSSKLLVPEKWRTLYALNPLVGIIEEFRVTLLGGQFDSFALLISVVFTIVILICAAYSFRRIEKNFADLI